MNPTLNPAVNPNVNPTYIPAVNPAFNPAVNPNVNPTYIPAVNPTYSPTVQPQTTYPTVRTATVQPNADHYSQNDQNPGKVLITSARASLINALKLINAN